MIFGPLDFFGEYRVCLSGSRLSQQRTPTITHSTLLVTRRRGAVLSDLADSHFHSPCSGQKVLATYRFSSHTRRHRSITLGQLEADSSASIMVVLWAPHPGLAIVLRCIVSDDNS